MLVKESDIIFKDRWFCFTECEDGYFLMQPCRIDSRGGEIVPGERHKQRLWDLLKDRPGTNFYFAIMNIPAWLDPEFVPF